MEDDQLANDLRSIFLEELAEILENLEGAFLRFEKDNQSSECINELFRYFHNIKGSSKTVGLNGLSSFTHSAENILGKLRSGEMFPDGKVIAGLLEAIKLMRAFYESISDGNSSAESFLVQHQSVLNGLLEDNKDQTVEGFKIFHEDVVENSQPVRKEPNKPERVRPRSEENIKLPIRKIDELLDLFGEQVILQSSLDHVLEQDLEEQREFIRKTITSLKKITQDLQHTMVSLRMVAIRPLFNRMERTVRDVAKETGKEIEFIRQGDTSELDKNIVDSLIDPLNHMIRNAVDHGIECPDEREKIGKSRVGRVSLLAARNGGAFEIVLEDDGQGLDREKIIEKARRLNLLAGHGDSMSDQEVFDLIFHSGFSTRENATQISGRGVGMDVVREKITSLKGTCQISSVRGQGTRFLLRLPLSLAMFNGTIVSVLGERYVVPNSDFSEAIPISTEVAKDIEENRLVRIKDRVFKAINLCEVLRTEPKHQTNKSKQNLALITKYENTEYAFLVNDILSQEQIVLKRLGPEFRQVQASSGGTILGDGQVALVLDLNSLVVSEGRKAS